MRMNKNRSLYTHTVTNLEPRVVLSIFGPALPPELPTPEAPHTEVIVIRAGKKLVVDLSQFGAGETVRIVGNSKANTIILRGATRGSYPVEINIKTGDGKDLIVDQASSRAYVDLVVDLGRGKDRYRGKHIPVEVHGGRGNDTLIGSTAHDVLFGEAGRDLLSGRSGADWLDGGFDSDTIFGGSGNDTLIGGPDNDRLKGGGGVDDVFSDFVPGSFFSSSGSGNTLF